MKRQSNNILHLMGMDSTKYGGIERFNVELSRQLAEKGYHSVFVYERWPDVEQFAIDIQQAGAEIIVLNSRKNPMAFCHQLWTLFRRYHFCMMHAHFTKARFYAVPLAMLYGIRNIVYTFHSRVPSLNEMKLHTRLWYRLFNRYCRVVAVSKQIESVATANWPDMLIKNLYLGIHPVVGDKLQCRAELGIKENEMMVSCIANFNHIKGLDILTNAIKKLSDEIGLSKVSFYIIGQPEKDIEELKILADRLGVSSHIHMEGISNQIPKYLCAADIYIQPSRSEGLPLALMEAASAYLPLIASRVGGIPEVAIEGENAILFEPGNINECATALQTMLMDSSLRQKLGENSKRVYTEKFQISNNVNKLIEYYNLK